MRVLHVVQELRRGGAETITLDLMKESSRRGHQVAVSAAPGPWSIAFHGFAAGPFRLPMIGRRPGRLPQAVASVRQAIREFAPDAVHAHNPTMALITGLATGRGRLRPALTTVHGLPEHDYRAAATLLRLAGLPVFGCGPGVTAALHRHGISADTVINGIRPAPRPVSRSTVLTEHRLPADGPLIISVGRLTEQKRHDRAIDLLGSLPDASLIILGEGPLRSALTNRAERLGVSDRLRLPGVRSDARQLMAAADVIISTSDWEGLPLSLLEAMASGTPVVATAVRGIRELITDGYDGLLCPPDDVAALTRAVRTVTDPATRQIGTALSEAARRTAQGYSVESMTETYLDHYRKLAS